MKLMIVSDIHGSAYYCEKLLERYHEEKPDKLLVLGDILYHGPRNDLPKDYDPKKVIALLNPLKDKIVAVRGNCDAEVDQMVLEFPIMADYEVMNVDGINIYLTHGHVYNIDKPIPQSSDIVLYGHTHIPANEVRDNIRYLNPGSVSIPKNNSRHSYMIYEDKCFKWKDLESKEIYDEYRC